MNLRAFLAIFCFQGEVAHAADYEDENRQDTPWPVTVRNKCVTQLLLLGVIDGIQVCNVPMHGLHHQFKNTA